MKSHLSSSPLVLLEDYRKKNRDYKEKLKELEELTSKRDSIKFLCDDLKKKRLDEFMTGFHSISQKLKQVYQLITLGGNAELELVDSLDPFSEGIIFSVMPPKKSWKIISNLSGGERVRRDFRLRF
jgi:structural maintenance of chromosome 4